MYISLVITTCVRIYSHLRSWICTSICVTTFFIARVCAGYIEIRDIAVEKTACKICKSRSWYYSAHTVYLKEYGIYKIYIIIFARYKILKVDFHRIYQSFAYILNFSKCNVLNIYIHIYNKASSLLQIISP